MMVMRKNHGFTILEVLISLLVVALGMLALAGMQLKSIRDAHDAYVRSLASEVATETSERIRTAVGDQMYTVNTTTGKVDMNPAIACYLSGASATTSCSTVASSVQTIVTADIASMALIASQSLSSGTFSTTLRKVDGTTTNDISACSYTLSTSAASATAGTSCSVLVTVAWQEKAAVGSGTNSASFTYAFR